MKSDKVRAFIELAGTTMRRDMEGMSPAERRLGAQLLLSEVLEYVVDGLGVTPYIGDTAINQPNGLRYETHADCCDKLAMIDGLADTAYTMYWNAIAFGVPLEEAFELVCDNNLEKFVHLPDWGQGSRALETGQWDLGTGVQWPDEVVEVCVVEMQQGFYAVGRDQNGKVRKPSTYRAVELERLVK